MVVDKKAFKLIEKASNKVSWFWRVAQICGYSIAIVSGMFGSVAFGQALKYFDYNCIFNATFIFNDIHDGMITFDHNSDVKKMNFAMWGKPSMCQYCQFVPIVAGVFAFVWATFFTMCGNGGKTSSGLPQPWRIVLPALIFSFVGFVLVIDTASTIHSGISTVCGSLTRQMKGNSCAEVMSLNWKEHQMSRFAYKDMITAEVCTWIQAAAWLWATLLLLIRWFSAIDFDLVEEVHIRHPPPTNEGSFAPIYQEESSDFATDESEEVVTKGGKPLPGKRVTIRDEVVRVG